MKKILFIFLLLLSPIMVFAKNACNSDDIKIKSIILKDTKEFSEEVEDASINNNTINLNLKMYDVGDSSTYNITIENNSGEEYYFTNDSMKIDNDYLEYSLKNNSEVIPAHSEKGVELRITYKNKIPNESYSDTNNLSITLSDRPLDNPKTSTNYIFLFMLVILILICIKYHKKGLLVLSILGIFSNVYALCAVNINIQSKIEIENKEAIFLPGREVNVKMKELAGDDTSTSTNGYSFSDENIMSIMHSESEPIASNKEGKNIVSTVDSPYPIYMWYEDGTIYWWSVDSHPSLNANSSSMFMNFSNLADIKGLERFDTSLAEDFTGFFIRDSLTNLVSLKNWDTSKVQNMNAMFARNSMLSSLSGIEDWDTSNVTNMRAIFSYDSSLLSLKELKNWNTSNNTNLESSFMSAESLTSLEGLEDWDTSKVTNMNHTFSGLSLIRNLDVLTRWNVSNVTNMRNLFAMDSSIESIKGLKDWDVSKVTTMYGLFWGNSMTSILDLKNWDTSSVTEMYGMFHDCSMLESLDGLENWVTSNVTTMYGLFDHNISLKFIKAIQNWDVSKVAVFSWMFDGDEKIIDSTVINGWDISSTATFQCMFRGAPTHPEFSKVPGTWNSSGTFTPTP